MNCFINLRMYLNDLNINIYFLVRSSYLLPSFAIDQLNRLKKKSNFEMRLFKSTQ